MATKTKSFEMFGVSYRSIQFSAVRALEMIAAQNVSPLEALERTSVLVGEDWVELDSRERVNQYVRDRAELISPHLVLRGLLKTVGDHSCGIAKGWKGVKIPTRFTADGQGLTTRRSAHVDPVVETILQHDAATLRELEEYYSLEDAFKMLDVIVAKGVNDALAQEAAAKNARRK
jgi:hypothetical protein